MTLSNIVKQAEKFAVDNSPSILTAIGVTGVVTTAYLTGKASYRVGLDMNAGHYEPMLEGDEPEYFDAKIIVKRYWKEFIPAVGTGILTIGAVVAANRIGTRRAAALAAAYSISEKAFTEYKEKVIEKLGKSKEQAVRDEVAQDQVKKNPVNGREVIITGPGDVLCYDAFTGRYFQSNMETLKKAQNDVNYKVLNDMYASLTDFYNLIGLPQTAYSEEVGWNSDKLMELEFSATIAEDGRPCISVNFAVAPVRDYYRLL